MLGAGAAAALLVVVTVAPADAQRQSTRNSDLRTYPGAVTRLDDLTRQDGTLPWRRFPPARTTPRTYASAPEREADRERRGPRMEVTLPTARFDRPDLTIGRFTGSSPPMTADPRLADGPARSVVDPISARGYVSPSDLIGRTVTDPDGTSVGVVRTVRRTAGVRGSSRLVLALDPTRFGPDRDGTVDLRNITVQAAGPVIVAPTALAVDPL
ncbi:MAG: hypothetical protein ACTS3R_21210 [Inquilinaceae bacterium]